MQRAAWLLAILLVTAPLAGCLGPEEGRDGTDDGDTSGPGDDRTDGSGEDQEGGLAWVNRTPVPTPRTEVATAILDGELYVIGGFESNDQPSTVVEVLNLTEDEWREVASLPTPLHHARAVALDGAVHVFGGYNAVPFQATPTHVVYDPAADSWQQAEPLPNARGGHGAAVFNDSAYLVGGVGADGELLATVDVFHPDDGSYTQAPDLPSPRDHLGVAATETGVHAVGGREQSLDSNLATHEVYVPGHEWIEAQPMPTARGGIDAAELDGFVVVAGGEAQEETFGEVEAWHPRQPNWTSLPDMPTPRHGLGVDSYHGQLITTAGGPEPGLSVSDAVEVLPLATEDETT